MTDPNSYKARLEAKLQPARVRATLAFAGRFQLTHEMLRAMVLDDVKSFYGYISVGDGTWQPYPVLPPALGGTAISVRAL